MDSQPGPLIGWKPEYIPGQNPEIPSAPPGTRKRKDSSSSTSSTSSSSSSSSSSSADSPSTNRPQKLKNEKIEKRRARKEVKKQKKEIRRQERRERRAIKKAKKEQRKLEKKMYKMEKKAKKNGETVNCGPPISLMNRKACAPETKEEWDARQSKIRRVQDPETGRYRLIKGDGEILEEIVSKDRHKEINKLATETDGQYFQLKTVGWNSNNK